MHNFSIGPNRIPSTGVYPWDDGRFHGDPPQSETSLSQYVCRGRRPACTLPRLQMLARGACDLPSDLVREPRRLWKEAAVRPDVPRLLNVFLIDLALSFWERQHAAAKTTNNGNSSSRVNHLSALAFPHDDPTLVLLSGIWKSLFSSRVMALTIRQIRLARDRRADPDCILSALVL